MNSYLLPKKIVSSKGLNDSDELFNQRPLQVSLAYPRLATISNGFIMFDFGKELRGGVRLLISDIEGGSNPSIRIRFGESISEANSEIGEDGATNDHSPRDFIVKLSQYSDNTFGQTGFRFVRIDFLDDKKIRIQNIYAASEYDKHKCIYSYKGNDKEIKKIFNIAKYTVDLCSSGEYVWDGIKRDRLAWYGVLNPELLALATLYGRHKSLENTLILGTKEYPIGTWMNGFPSYSMWWLVSIYDYYKMTKCDDFVIPLLDYIEALIKQMDNYIEENGEMKYELYFLDWPTYQSKAAEDGDRLLNIASVKRAKELLNIFNRDDSICDRVINKLNKVEIKSEYKQVIAMKYLAFGKIDDQEYKILIKDGSKGMSTFMSNYILTAIASKNREFAIDIFKEYYMGMVDLGATTFFEDFDLEFAKECGRIDKKNNKKDFHKTFGAFYYKGLRHSLCHGWSCGIIDFIKKYCD